VRIALKANEVRLTANISKEDFDRLVFLHRMGEIHVSLSVSHGERVGFISFDDIDICQTLESESESQQLPLDI